MPGGTGKAERSIWPYRLPSGPRGSELPMEKNRVPQELRRNGVYMQLINYGSEGILHPSQCTPPSEEIA
jgi:hypothetical protein